MKTGSAKRLLSVPSLRRVTYPAFSEATTTLRGPRSFLHIMDLTRFFTRIILQEPHLDLGALRNQLECLDESSLGDLLAFKKDLENKLSDPASLVCHPLSLPASRINM